MVANSAGSSANVGPFTPQDIAYFEDLEAAASAGVQAGNYSNSTPADVNWQNQILAQMSQAGQLYGINPLILEAMGQEESGREVAGAGYNSAGYGGYFGLSANKYPGGQIPVSELLTNSQQSFIQQAQVAASAFASYLQRRLVATSMRLESIYQTGKPGGDWWRSRPGQPVSQWSIPLLWGLGQQRFHRDRHHRKRSEQRGSVRPGSRSNHSVSLR